MAQKNRATMNDVAKNAGVSHQTVSRVINNHPHIRPETRAKVLAAIDELNYHPNTSARALASSKSGVIGVIVGDSCNYGPASTLQSLLRSTQAVGWFASVLTLENLSEEAISTTIHQLQSQSVEGVVAISLHEFTHSVAAQFAQQTPVIGIDPLVSPNSYAIDMDHVQGGELATKHLLDLGHRTVHHIAGRADMETTHQRIKGWRNVLSDHNAVIDEPWFGNWTPESGYDLAAEVAKQASLGSDSPHRLTAVFCGNDQMALGLIRGLHERGIRVPEDISVVGYDNLPESEFFLPPLTTVQQDFSAIGHQSVTTLQRLLADESVERTTWIAPQLIDRNSTAPPAALPGVDVMANPFSHRGQ